MKLTYLIIWTLLISLTPSILRSQSFEVDFGPTGSLEAGTPLGNGPGWLFFANNGNRWDSYAGNGGYYIGRNVGTTALYINNESRVGINKVAPGKFIDVFAGTPGTNEGLRVLHTSGYGAALLANNGNIGGWFVTNGGSNYAPIWASDFLVPTTFGSSVRSNDINILDQEKWLDKFDKLKTTTYYSHERATENIHIGILAQTAPAEMISYAPRNPDGLGERIMMINLTDWTGLNTVVIKYLRAENKSLQEEIDGIRKEMLEMKVEIEKIRTGNK